MIDSLRKSGMVKKVTGKIIVLEYFFWITWARTPALSDRSKFDFLAYTNYCIFSWVSSLININSFMQNLENISPFFFLFLNLMGSPW